MPLTQILFVELLGGLGDLTIALPSIHTLACSHPGASLSVFCFQPYADLLAHDPYITTVFTATKGDRPDGVPLAREELARLLANHQFDLVVTDTRYGGIDETIEQSGATEKATHLWNQTSPNERIEQAFLRNLIARDFVRPEFADETARLVLTTEERAWAKDWCESNIGDIGPFVLFNPEAGIPAKCWPAHHFVALGHALHHDTSLRVVIATGDRPSLAKIIAHAIDNSTIVLPRLPIRQFASVASRASAFISADTGPARVAAAVDTPVIGLFGPTWSGRYGLPAPSINLQAPHQCHHYQAMNITTQPCWYGHCPLPEQKSCMDNIEPSAVASVLLHLLDQHQAKPGRALKSNNFNNKTEETKDE